MPGLKLSSDRLKGGDGLPRVWMELSTINHTVVLFLYRLLQGALGEEYLLKGFSE